MTVEYKPGKLNGAADVLSRRDEVLLNLRSISTPTFALFDTLRAEMGSDLQAVALRLSGSSWWLELRRKGGPRLMVSYCSRENFCVRCLIHLAPVVSFSS